MKRTVITIIAGQACIATTFEQTSEDYVPAKGFVLFSAKGTFRLYEFIRHAIGEMTFKLSIFTGIEHSETNLI